MRSPGPSATKRCVFLTYARSPLGTADDRLAIRALEALGWTVATVPWRSAGQSAPRWDAVVIRSTWDYHRHAEEFLDVLASIERAGARLFNSLGLVRWNASKTYLRDLAARGVVAVPTVWRDRIEPGGLAAIFDALEADDIVVKPVVSASAEGAARIDRRAPAERSRQIEAFFAARPVMAQPVARAVLEEGEHSLIYLDGTFSHAVRKTPKAGDFRVQEEHGGTIRLIDAEAPLRAAGDAILAELSELPLYARVDVVRSNDGAGWWLMELELIEPTLYLGMQPGAPERFARALDARYHGRLSGAAGRDGDEST